MGPHQPTVDVQVALRNHGPLHRRVTMLGNPDAGAQHRPVREPSELADLGACVIGRSGKVTAGGHVDLDVSW
ncbi:hypothetical protein NIIDMKKI_64790 [Mycobacterium kansasii]|uniref:Uncharacterized protein n=1 Tax=Mycobacterium kansasii TaxID=1768 RepID=A0A7G1IN47_MYCKA|nr:hypothetical protein NIIDMKKI_64790 [Mycobacterium kansasii]